MLLRGLVLVVFGGFLQTIIEGNEADAIRDPFGNFVVAYRSYLTSVERQTILHDCLSSVPASAWKIQERSASSKQFPSDFDVLGIQHDSVEKTRKVLLSCSNVKSITTDRQYHRKLQAFHTPDPACGGRSSTKWSWDNETEALLSPGRRKLLRALPQESITDSLQADEVWRLGFSGRGVRVGIFDTGLRDNHPHFRNVKSRTDWTGENILDDGVGHGTFVAGIVASSSECLGFAPDAELHIFRVFTNLQVSFTSWFLDALNFAIYSRIHVINLSIGGPDFLDIPFVDKVNELTANNVILVSAIGNDGPLYGTLNNPADMTNVLGVGGIAADNTIAPFSSRGMTLWELPRGMGRVKPDLVTYSTNIRGSHFHRGCRSLSGTSVASPVVAGAVSLLASVVPQASRARLVTPASMKQALTETALRLPGPGIFEQGQGRIDVPAAAEFLRTYRPRASVVPPALDATDCPYMWPYCAQPLFYGGAPLVANLSILNGMAVLGWVEQPVWYSTSPRGDELLDVAFDYAASLWPWGGHFGLILSPRAQAFAFTGVVAGMVVFNVTSPPEPGGTTMQRCTVSLPFKVKVVPPPPRRKRVLWDQSHSLSYPSGFFPRDTLTDGADPLDWHGDHPYTNFRAMFQALRALDYFVDVLGQPWVCFDAANYGTLLIVDPEDEFFDEEIAKLHNDVEQHGLRVVVVADWYSTDQMARLRFFDENTQSWWQPETGGCNTPGLNRLLHRWGIQLAPGSYSGDFSFNGRAASFLSGSVLAAVPFDALVMSALLSADNGGSLGPELVASRVDSGRGLGMIAAQVQRGAGHVIVFGDSACLDDAARLSPARRCDWLLAMLLDEGLSSLSVASAPPLSVPPLPGGPSLLGPRTAVAGTLLHVYSRVLHNATHQQPLPACPRIAWTRPVPPATIPLFAPTPRKRAVTPPRDVSTRDVLHLSPALVVCIIVALVIGFFCFLKFSTASSKQPHRVV